MRTNKRGQAASEFMILMGAMLLVAIIAVALAVVWPSYLYSIDKQRSDDYWTTARPFSVAQHILYPDKMVIQLQNTEPVSLTLKGIYLDDEQKLFLNHTIPFSWTTTDACPGGECTLLMKPGQTQVISTETLDDSVCGNDPNAYYRVGLTIMYKGSNETLYNQTSPTMLVGTCSTR